MIGVDVVDLRNPRTQRRHLDQRFLGRIFSEDEQALIRGSRIPDLTLWCLWAMKEAAFKAIGAELHPATPPVFTHPDFRAELGSDALTGRVIWRDREVRAQIHLAGERGPDQERGPGGLPTGDGVRRGDSDPLWCTATATLRATSDADAEVHSGAQGPDHRVESTRSVAAALALGDDGDPRELLSMREQASVHSRASALVRLAARGSIAEAAEIAGERLEIVAGDHPDGRTPPIVLLDGVETGALQVTLSHDGPWIAWGWRVGDSLRKG